MSSPSANHVVEKEAVRQIFDGINSDDITKMLQFFDPAAERMEPPGFPNSGTYRGHEELKKNMMTGRTTWAEGSCTPEELLASGDKVVALVHVHVRLKNETKWIDAHIADGFVFREGKVIFWRTFVSRQEALVWAGIEVTP